MVGEVVATVAAMGDQFSEQRLTAGQILRRLAWLSMTPLCAIAPDKLAEMELRIVFRRLSFYTLHKSRITIHSLP